jgi:hypothetical protein
MDDNCGIISLILALYFPFGIIFSDPFPENWTFEIIFAAYINSNNRLRHENGFKFALSQKFSENLEIDFSMHFGCFVTEVPQKSGYRFRFFDRNYGRRVRTSLRGILYRVGKQIP